MISTAPTIDKEELDSLLDKMPSHNDLLSKEFIGRGRTGNEDFSIGHTAAVLQSLPVNRRSDRRIVKQRFEGVVISVQGDEFKAEIHDLDHPDNPIEEVVFFVSDVVENDRKLLKNGSVFNWYLGVIVEREFQTTNEPYSKIAFRHFPQRTESEFKRARQEAEKLANQFKKSD